MNRAFVCFAAFAVAGTAAFAEPAFAQQSTATVQGKYLPKADPAADLKKAEAAAAEQGKRVLLVVGGDWCVDCVILDQFLTQSKAVQAEFDKTFVTAKIYLGPENLNPEFLKQYPEIEWVPQFFVLDAKGKLLKAQDTRELSSDHEFHKDKMMAFAKKWRGS